MVITPNNYLDLYNIFVNEISGSIWIFVAIALIIMMMAAMKYGVPREGNLLLIVIFLVVAYIGSLEPIFYLIALLGVSVYVGYNLSMWYQQR